MADTKFPLSLVIRAVDGVTKPLEAINARLEKSFAPFAKLGNSFGALGKAMGGPALVESFGRARDAAGNLGDKVLGLGKMFAGLALGSAGLLTIVRSAEEAGSRLNDMSTRTGLSVQAFAELEFAAKKAGVGGEEFAGGMEKFNKGLSEARRNTGPLAELLKKVGPVYLQQLKGAKSNEEAFTLLAKAMKALEKEEGAAGKRAELAAAAFGKSGIGMINVLKDGDEPIAQLRAEFLKLAGDQTEFAKNSDALGDSFDNLETSLLGVRNVAAGALMPAITRLTEIVTGFVVTNRDGIQQWAERTGAAIQKWIDGGGVDRLVKALGDLKDTVVTVVDKVGGMENALKLVALVMAGPTLIAAGQFGIALVSLTANIVSFGARLGGLQLATWAADWVKYLWMMRGSIMSGLIPSLTAAAASVWSFTVALLANPITWIVAGIVLLAGAVYLIYRNWDKIAAFFWERWDAVKKIFSGFLSWVGKNLSWTPLGMIVNNWEPVKAFFVGLWDSITAIFRGAWETISPIVDKVMSVAQFIPGLGGAVTVVNGARSLFGGEGAAPALGAAGALPPPRASETKVMVDFVNVPRGVRVTPTQQAPEFELNLGLAMAPGT